MDIGDAERDVEAGTRAKHDEGEDQGQQGKDQAEQGVAVPRGERCRGGSRQVVVPNDI